MSDTLSTFERLVVTLESDERKVMLRQLAESSEQQTESIKEYSERGTGKEAAHAPSSMRLSDEPLIVRLWFGIRAFFTSTTSERAYSKYLVSELGRRLTRTSAEYVNVGKGLYTDALCAQLAKLRSAQTFFSALLSSYELGKGEFYVALSSLLMNDVNAAVAAASDPFALTDEQARNRDVRAYLIRETEAALQSIPEAERARMYQSAQAIEWIRRFCELPIERMILRFVNYGQSGRMCLFDSVSGEMQDLVAVFSGAKRVPVLMLEALFLFAKQDEMQGGKFDIEHECRQFVSAATSHLSGIGAIKASIPLIDFVRFAVKDVRWQPAALDGGEDWFASYRAAWRKRFEERFADWNSLRQRTQLRHDLCAFLDVDDIEPLQFHPWEGMWLPLSMRRELSLSFLKRFFAVIYPAKIMRPLKILLIDGEFYRRENMIEFTDSFSVLEHQAQAIDTFENRLSPKGDIGNGFELAQSERMATVKGKARLENLMLTVDSEAEVMIARAIAAFKNVDNILQGILDVARGGPYETLVNMASIQGKLNEQYRKELEYVRQTLRGAVALLLDAETMEKAKL